MKQTEQEILHHSEPTIPRDYSHYIVSLRLQLDRATTCIGGGDGERHRKTTLLVFFPFLVSCQPPPLLQPSNNTRPTTMTEKWAEALIMSRLLNGGKVFQAESIKKKCQIQQFPMQPSFARNFEFFFDALFYTSSSSSTQ